MDILASEAVSQRIYMMLEESQTQMQQDRQNLSPMQAGIDNPHPEQQEVTGTDGANKNMQPGGRHVTTLAFDPSKLRKGFLKKEGPNYGHASWENEDKKPFFGIKTERKSEFVCEVCSEFFPTLLSLQVHEKIHATGEELEKVKKVYTRRRPFKYRCSVCGKCFHLKDHLRYHVKKHTGDAPFRCVYCEKCFAHGKNLHRHVKVAHKEAWDLASGSTRVSKATNTLENGLILITDDNVKPYKCSLCSKTFRRLYRVKEHTRTHSGQKPFQCSICNKLFNSSDILYRHVKKIHNGGVPILSTAIKSPKIEPDLGNQTVIEITPINTQQIQQDVGQINFLNIAKHAELIDLSQSGETSYNNTTYYIDVRPDFGEQLQVQHMPPLPQTEQVQTTTTEKAFQCSLCGESFVSLPLLTRHVQTHKLQVSSKCTICDRDYRNASDLKRHMVVHTGEKPFKCSLCPKSFHRQYRLNNHWRTHSGEKPYQCSVCGKVFTVSDNMYRHIRKMHNGEGLKNASEMVKRIQDINRARKYETVEHEQQAVNTVI